MPWKADDAKHKTKKAKTKKQQQQWAKVANSVLKTTGDEAQAIRTANAAIAKKRKKK